MSAFLTELEVELVSDATNSGRGTWRLTAPLVYQSDIAQQTFTVPAGFETDFASVPRVPVAFLLAADSAHEASALHDFLYTSPHPVSRAMADAVLREAAVVSGVPAWRAWLMWAGVRIGGGTHWGSAEALPG
ncbi:TPA: DUF1353 domain-containing protein [Burkholderia multivorans]|nr:DUF1353 domain-containing protein [Burkholderia multivorans]HEM7871149.1 DUF1353 domain-containing protein [Burkholderia multivorans]HEM7905371.1 DUF1353 domain-containing protein [Burkholderia multivorans]HEM8537562.1 DUF1353 domain-containing protein [Burkholderia multivorans]